MADHRRRMMAAEAADIDPVHEHVVGGLGDQPVRATPGSVGVQQLVNVRAPFPRPGPCRPCSRSSPSAFAARRSSSWCGSCDTSRPSAARRTCGCPAARATAGRRRSSSPWPRSRNRPGRRSAPDGSANRDGAFAGRSARPSGRPSRCGSTARRCTRSAPRYSSGCEVKLAPTSTISIGVLTFFNSTVKAGAISVMKGNSKHVSRRRPGPRVAWLLRLESSLTAPLAAFDLQVG